MKLPVPVPAKWTDVGLLWPKLEEVVARGKQASAEDSDVWDLRNSSPSSYLAMLWAHDQIEVRYRPKAIGTEQEARHELAVAGFSDRLRVRFTLFGDLFHLSRLEASATAATPRQGRPSAIAAIVGAAGGLGRLVGYDVQVRRTRDPTRPSWPLTPADLSNLKSLERRTRLVYSVWAMKGFPSWTARQAFQEARSFYLDRFGELPKNLSESVENNTWTEVKRRRHSDR